jgi:hypothetical protein
MSFLVNGYPVPARYYPFDTANRYLIGHAAGTSNLVPRSTVNAEHLAEDESGQYPFARHIRPHRTRRDETGSVVAGRQPCMRVR